METFGITSFVGMFMVMERAFYRTSGGLGIEYIG